MRIQIVTIFVTVLLAISNLAAQDNRLIPTGDVAYEYINRLQQQGHLLDLHPTALPYTIGELRKAMKAVDEKILTENHRSWLQFLKNRYPEQQIDDSESKTVSTGFDSRAVLRSSNNERLDVLRPLDDAEGDRNLEAWPRLQINGFLEYERFIVHAGVTMDRWYNDDPDGLDIVRRLWTRSEDTYIGFQHPFASIYFGRFNNHWTAIDQGGVSITNNTNSFDQLSWRIGPDKLSLRSFVGELDNLGPNGSFEERDRFKDGNIRRYIAMHRVDWRPNNNWAFTIYEGVLYSGANAGLSLNYGNPLHFLTFVSDNNPKNFENNLMIGGFFWGYYKGFTVNGQLALDDVIINNRGDVREVGELEPASAAITFSLSNANLIKNWNIGIETEVISSQVFSTDQTEGQWSFAQRGLATNFTDYAYISLFGDYYGFNNRLEGLRVTPSLDILLQGEQDLRLPLNDDSGPFILTGTTQSTVRPGLRGFYQPSERWWLRFDLGLNVTRDKNNIMGNDETDFVGLITVGARFSKSGNIQFSEN